MLKIRKECKTRATEKKAVQTVSMEGSMEITREVVSPDSSLLLLLWEPKELAKVCGLEEIKKSCKKY